MEVCSLGHNGQGDVEYVPNATAFKVTQSWSMTAGSSMVISLSDVKKYIEWWNQYWTQQFMTTYREKDDEKWNMDMTNTVMMQMVTPIAIMIHLPSRKNAEGQSQITAEGISSKRAQPMAVRAATWLAVAHAL